MPHTLAEKLLARRTDQEVGPGRIVSCRLDRVLANDITAPLAIKSFKGMGACQVYDRDKVVLVMDHFTPNKDLDSAEQVRTCRVFAREMDITHYYEGGDAGVEHALLPEKGLAGRGDVIVGADSHTCTYGGLGAFATGMGSTDIAAAMALGETWFKIPESILVRLSGSFQPWLGGKDIILALIGLIGVDGALYRALEVTGPLLKELTAEGRMTIANMAIEAGGKVGLFPVDNVALEYARAHGHPGCEPLAGDPGAEYARTVDIDASGLAPQVACPHLPENVKPVAEVDVAIDQSIIGSCTNGRIEDLRLAAQVLQGRKVAKGVRCIVLPATPAIWRQAMGEGLFDIFMDAGCVVGPPTCGPCLGGHMGILAKGEKAVSTTNRNFRGRMGSLESEVYLANPAVAAASAVAGRIIGPGKL